jgi:hypothetical protein
MQNDFDILRRVTRRDVDEPKPNPIALQIHGDRPIEMAIAIAAHDRDRRAKRLDCLQNAWIAYVAEMPDFVGGRCHCLNVRRQFVVRIGEDENSKRCEHC